MASGHSPPDTGPEKPTLRRWMPWTMAALMGWNLGITGLYFEARTARADSADCPGLRREVVRLRDQLGTEQTVVRHLTHRLHNLALGNIQSIEKALAGTGIAVDRLIARGRSAPISQGGPFIPAPTQLGAAARQVERWDSLKRVISVLPLGAPIDGDYEVSSPFGKRSDPINRRSAQHEGIDLKAPLRTPVLATGPGTVAFAGRLSGYGLTVEIDHGLGVKSRYAHLGAIHVREGQFIPEGRRIGLLGSTGRSTGPHLHYEVVVDEKPNNPARFMQAGTRLKGRWGMPLEKMKN